jgi:hypothetical protein
MATLVWIVALMLDLDGVMHTVEIAVRHAEVAAASSREAEARQALRERVIIEPPRLVPRVCFEKPLDRACL